MSDLTEVEIFDTLTSNLREAATHCAALAGLPAKGPSYGRLRINLLLIEGACRQMGFFRDDMRYQVLGAKAAECHRRAGDWLRAGAAPMLFNTLGDVMRKLLTDIERLRHTRTGRRGPILVPPQPAAHRDTRPVSYAGLGPLNLAAAS